MTSSGRRLVAIGNYRVLDSGSSTLGKGSFARVERAKHCLLKTHVALKVIYREKLNRYAKDNLYREAEILSGLDHPNIVKMAEICATKKVAVCTCLCARNPE